jgi:hypothetical protein
MNVSDKELLRVAFYATYLKMLSIEKAVTGMVLDPKAKMSDFICAHNIVEEAKGEIVKEFLGFRIGLRR